MILLADDEGPDQRARMLRLIWAFIFRICLKTRYHMALPSYVRFSHMWLKTRQPNQVYVFQLLHGALGKCGFSSVFRYFSFEIFCKSFMCSLFSNDLLFFFFFATAGVKCHVIDE